MFWDAVAGAGGSLLGGLLGDDKPFDPLDHIYGQLYGQDWASDPNNPAFGDGLIPLMQRDIRRNDAFYGNLAQRSGRFTGQQQHIARRNINHWERDEGAGAAQSLANSGLLNTTLRQSADTNIGQAAQRMRTDARYQIGSAGQDRRNAYRIAGHTSSQGMRDRMYGMQLGPAQMMFGMGQGSGGATGAAAGGWGNLLTQLLGGSFPGGAPGSNSGGSSWWEQLLS